MTELSSRFATALSFAAELHREHYRKGTNIPYASHLLAVASLALEYGADEDEAIAALLHDAQEDRGGEPTTATIRILFGNRVAYIVEGCSDSVMSDNKGPWKERKEKYLMHLPMAPASVRLVSVCDKIHNARAILADLRSQGDDLWPRFNGGKEGTLWYYRSLVEEFTARGPRQPADELARVVDEIERVAGKPSTSEPGKATLNLGLFRPEMTDEEIQGVIDRLYAKKEK